MPGPETFKAFASELKLKNWFKFNNKFNKVKQYLFNQSSLFTVSKMK